MNISKCDICGTEKNVEFTVRSNHLTVHCERFFKELNVKDVTTAHINKHLCIKCFNKIFETKIKGENENE